MDDGDNGADQGSRRGVGIAADLDPFEQGAGGSGGARGSQSRGQVTGDEVLGPGSDVEGDAGGDVDADEAGAHGGDGGKLHGAAGRGQDALGDDERSHNEGAVGAGGGGADYSGEGIQDAGEARVFMDLSCSLSLISTMGMLVCRR